MARMAIIELQACRHCGSTPHDSASIWHPCSDVYYVRCQKCRCTGPQSATAAGAKRAWNYRFENKGQHAEGGDIDLAADMLEFFFGQLQMHSPDMGGQHSYRFRSGGWPMTHCKGPSAEEAVVAAIEEVKRSKNEAQ